MGTTIAKNSLAAQQTMYRLTVDCSSSNSGQAISISKLLSAELLNVRPRMRSMQMEKCLINVLDHLPENPLIKDIDVMFNPTYAVDELSCNFCIFLILINLVMPATKWETEKRLRKKENKPISLENKGLQNWPLCDTILSGFLCLLVFL